MAGRLPTPAKTTPTLDYQDLILQLKIAREVNSIGKYMAQTRSVEFHDKEFKNPFKPGEVEKFRNRQGDVFIDWMKKEAIKAQGNTSRLSEIAFIMNIYNALVFHDSRIGACEDYTAYSMLVVLNYLKQHSITTPLYMAKASTHCSVGGFDHAYLILSTKPLKVREKHVISALKECWRIDLFEHHYDQVKNLEQAFVDDSIYNPVTLPNGLQVVKKGEPLKSSALLISIDDCISSREALAKLNTAWQVAKSIYEPNKKKFGKAFFRTVRPTGVMELVQVDPTVAVNTEAYKKAAELMMSTSATESKAEAKIATSTAVIADPVATVTTPNAEKQKTVSTFPASSSSSTLFRAPAVEVVTSTTTENKADASNAESAVTSSVSNNDNQKSAATISTSNSSQMFRMPAVQSTELSDAQPKKANKKKKHGAKG